MCFILWCCEPEGEIRISLCDLLKHQGMYTNAQSNRTSIDFNLESILLTEEASLIYKLVTLNKNVNLVATLIVTQ